MKSTDAALLTALVLVFVLVLAAWHVRKVMGAGGPRARYCPGPGNLNLYDRPYENYPTYEGRGATWWDGDRRCAAFCQQSPCAVWCR
jgi:hypothetical protein